MRIESIELRHLRMRLRAPFETSFGVEHDRECMVLRVEADGLQGWGECVAGRFPGYSYETVGSAWHLLSQFLLPAVLGKDIDDIRSLRSILRDFRGNPLAKAGLELAVWDLMGKATGRSLSKMLGGTRAKVPVGVSIGIKSDIASLLASVEAYVQAGYRRVKLKIKPGRDVDELREVRRAFPDLPLQVDANSAYTLEDSRVFEALDDLGLLMIEQPLAEDDLLDHSRLQARLRTPLCLDESIKSVRHARQAIETEACRIINIKPARVGGLFEALEIHNHCLEQSIPVWCGGMLETGIGRASNLALASLEGFTLPGDISASERYYVRDIAEPAFVLNPDSTIDVPIGPGLGVEVKLDVLESVSVRSERFAV